MKFHPDVLAAHAEFGGDLYAMQALYDRPDHLARIAELEAENERLARELAGAHTAIRGLCGAIVTKDEAISRTGAVKALDIPECVLSLSGSNISMAFETDDDALLALERIETALDASLSALEPAAPEEGWKSLFTRPSEQAVTTGPVLLGRKFAMHDRVTKIKGSSWTGRVVGFYSTALTPIGYAVESETETGSVQIYPEAALKAAMEAG